MNELIISIGCGSLGGAVRGIVGVVKSRQLCQRISARQLVLSVIAAGIIGGFAAAVLFSDYKVALLAGYAGLDLLENMAKMLRQEQLNRQADSA